MKISIRLRSLLTAGCCSALLSGQAQTIVNTQWVVSNSGQPQTTTVHNSIVDNQRNVYSTGQIVDGVSGVDVLTSKVDGDGNVLWTSAYNSSSNADEYGTALSLDANGDLYVVGSTSNSGDQDFLVLKYSSTGQLLW